MSCCIAKPVLITTVLLFFTLDLTLTAGRDPYITKGPRSQVWRANSGLQQLMCAARGSGKITIKWYKDQNPIEKNQTANARIWLYPETHAGIFYSPLNFRNVLKSDEGRYECVARNSKGMARSTAATLTVSGPPSVNLKKPLPKMISVAWHDTFNLQCIGKGPPKINKVIWDYKGYSANSKEPVLYGTQNKSLKDTNLRMIPREDDGMSDNVVKYEVFCTVRNAEGSSKSRTTIINIKQLPGVPAIREAIPLDLGRNVALHWTPGFNGFDMLQCNAEVANDSFVKSVQLPIEGRKDVYQKFITGLQPVTSYTVRIRCKNTIGYSDWTAKRSFTTKEGFPDQYPRNVKVTAINSTAINITWLPIPSDHVFGTLRGYRVRVQLGSEVKKRVTVGANDLHIEFSNLDPGNKYCATVLGFTKAKDGETSRLECAVLRELPVHPPIIKSIEIDSAIVTFVYVDEDNEKGVLRNCSLLIEDDEQHKTVIVRIPISDTVANMPVRNLSPNAKYHAKIKCYTVKRREIYSIGKAFKTAEKKPTKILENLQLRVEDRKLIAYWDPIDVKNMRSNFTGYDICILPSAGNKNSRCYRTFNTSYSFSHLEPGTTYTVTVAACTSPGCGPYNRHVETMPSRVGNPVTLPANTTIVDQTGAMVVEGHFNFVYAAIAVLVIAILVVSLALYVRRRKRQKENQRNGHNVAYTPANGGTVQSQPVVSPTPSNTNTLNSYEVPLLSNRPLMSPETLTKLEGLKFSRDRLLLGERLGRGEFGRVYKGKFRPLHPTGDEDEEGNLVIAVKTMIMDEYDASEREEFVKEGLRMKDMDHPNVMNLIGICLPEEGGGGHTWTRVLSGFEAISPLVVVPYMENGDLKHYLYTARIENETKHITLNKLLHFALDIASGMEYLSAKNIVHRDLACRNCMLDSNMRVVVSDFGLSRQIYSSNYYRQKRAAKMPVKWMALESLVDRIYSSMTDVWSFGVTAWEIFTFCQNPYPGVQNHEMHELLKAGTRLKQPRGCPNDIWNDAIYPCWDPRPEERCTFTELVEMFSGYLKSYPVDYESEVSAAAVYVNVVPPEGYEKLRSDTISSENNEIPMPYSSAIAKDTSTKSPRRKKQSRDSSSSKKKLLKKEQRNPVADDVPSTSGTSDMQRQNRDRSSSRNPLLGRKRKDTYEEEFVVDL